jgi:hypothetical protein
MRRGAPKKGGAVVPNQHCSSLWLLYGQSEHLESIHNVRPLYIGLITRSLPFILSVI